VESTHYEQATIAYHSGDYAQALRGFYQCLKEDYSSFQPGDAGLVYHRLGNSLLKLRNLNEAVTAYQKAIEDSEYTDHSGICVNLGTSLNGLGRYKEAVPYFEAALADPGYSTPYRAQMGLGAVYSKLGKYVEAGTAFRDAALDESNPDPVKALMNLGSTFMALNRPTDAVEAYLAVLDFRVADKTLGKAYDKLGQAYVAAQNHEEAIVAFEEAFRVAGYALNEKSKNDYDTALNLRKHQLELESEANAYTLQKADYSGFDYLEGQEPAQDELTGDTGHYGAGNVPVAENTGFFTATDAALIEHSKRQMRAERKLRHTGLKVFLAILIILILLLGGAVFAYSQGFGWPTQKSVIEDFFAAHAAGEDTGKYWINGEEYAADIDRILDGVAKSDSVTIDSIGSVEENGSMMSSARAVVTVHLPEGGTMHYEVLLTRDLIGWKINNVDIIFASQE
jgi:tetratricopeptide (TPR) repeat protein